MKKLDFYRLMQNKKIRYIYQIIAILFGSLVYSLGVSLFIDPNKLVTGGITGLAIIISKFIPINTGIVALIMNIPLLIAGLIVFGKGFVINTILGTCGTTLFVTLFEKTVGAKLSENPLTGNLLVAALFGGALVALGLAIIFSVGATSGGTDIIVRLVRVKAQNMSFGTIFLIADFCVVLLNMIIFKNIELALYSAVVIIVEDVLFDKFLYGFEEAKLLYIISDKSNEIKEKLLNDLEIGVTVLDGQGGYTGDSKKVLLVAIKKRLYPKVKMVIKSIDEDAFIIVNSAKEIYGLGFKKNDKKEI